MPSSSSCRSFNDETRFLGGPNKSIKYASSTGADPRRLSPVPPVHAEATTRAQIHWSKPANSPPDAQERKEQKLSEKQIKNRMPAPLPESRIYTQLLEFEARIDAAVVRKAKAIHEVIYGNPSMKRILRIYIFNTFSNQARRTAEPENAEPPSWSLKITGRIVEDEIKSDPVKGSWKPKTLDPKFSTFFKRVVVQLDEHLYPDDPVIVWESSRSAAPVEGFEIKRKGDKEFTARILLEMNDMPEEFRLSPALKKVLGIEFNTRAAIIARLFNYVKRKRLRNRSDPTEFVCDAPLKRVFGKNIMKFAAMSMKISQHLSDMPPIIIRHDVRLSGIAPGIGTCYDVLVNVPRPKNKEVQINLYANQEKKMELWDKMINTCLKNLHETYKRRAFFLRFSQSPEEFINDMIASQNGDFNFIGGKATHKRLTDHYSPPWEEEAVIRYLDQKLALENDTPAIIADDELKSIAQAIKCPYWQEAMAKEIPALE
uniref:SWI/SNF complex component SNF12 homolog n=1 Tax=Elaeis guineensis var. tenera TaxID=51953 RepID=A0A6I9RIF1_ELAGV|nr:SWI/SNF complex component SNF12 homolog [Elaeis guineensis]